MSRSFSLRTLGKKLGLVIFGLAIHICGANAQNSVGIGTATPNSRAVLELVSPGGDQGFLLPRLTTAQRTATAFTSALSSTENGMIVYDNDLDQFFYWQDNQWVAGLGAFSDQAGGDLTGTYPNPIIRSDAIDSDKILDGSILGADLSNNTITSSKLDAQGNTSAILATDISGNILWIPQTTFATTDLPNGEIMIGDNTNTAQSRPVTGDISLANDGTATIGDNTVTGAKIDDGTITSSDLADNSVNVDKLSTNAVSSDEVIDESLTSNDLGANSVGSSEVIDGSIQTDDVASGGNNKVLITTAAGTVFWENISLFETSSLPEGNIFLGDVSNNAAPLNAKGNGRILIGDGITVNSVGVNGDVTMDNSGNIQIKAKAVGTNELDDNAVTDAELADDAVDSYAIQDGAVETNKIKDAAVTSQKIEDLTIENGDLADNAVDSKKIDGEGNNNAVLTTDGSGNPQWEPQSFVDSNLPSAQIYIGDNANAAQAQALSGDVSLSNTGNVQLNANVVGTNEVIDNSITLDDIGPNAIAASELADNAVDAGAIQTDAVTGAKIVDGSVNTSDLSDNSVTSGKVNGEGNSNAVLTTDAGGNPQWENKSALSDADADPTNEIQDLSIAGNTLSLSGDASPVDLSGYLDNSDVQDLSLAGNTLSLTNDGTSVDLSGYLDNTDSQDLSNVLGQGNNAGGSAITNVADPSSAQDVATKNYVDGISVSDADADPSNEIQDLSIAGNILSLSSDASPVDLSGYLDNTDSQNLSNVLGQSNDAGGVKIVNVVDPTNAQDVATKNYVDGISTNDADADPNNEIQDLALAGNILSLSGDASTVNLSSYLDNTDAQDLSLAGNTLSLSNDGTPVNLGTYLDNTDSQNLSNVLGQGNDAGGVKITNVADPTNPQDVATMSYVDGVSLGFSSLSNGTLLIGDGTNTPQERVITGDITISNTGAATIAADAITTAKMDGEGNLDAMLITDASGNPQWTTQSSFFSTNVPDGSITSADIANNTIAQNDLASNSVGTSELQDNSVTTAKLTNNAVTTAKIAANAVGTSEIDGESNGDAVLTTTAAGNPQWEAKTNFDLDATNEIQDISLSGDALSLTGSVPTVDLTPYKDNTDAQTLSLLGNMLTISNGNTVDLSGVSSDRRLKKDIVPIEGSLTRIKELEGVSYTYRTNIHAAYQFDQSKQLGLIAQEVEKVFPELVITDSNGYKQVRYTALIPVLIEAIKEQQLLIDQLLTSGDKKEIDNQQLKDTLKKQSEMFKKQKKLLGQLQEENYHMQTDIELIKQSLGLEASTEN